MKSRSLNTQSIEPSKRMILTRWQRTTNPSFGASSPYGGPKIATALSQPNVNERCYAGKGLVLFDIATDTALNPNENLRHQNTTGAI